MNARLRPSVANGLHWVRGELDQSLQRARSLIEQQVENPGDTLPLQQAFVELHQVRGTASMIQCFGVSALAEEMKQALNDLMHNRIKDTEPCFAALLGANVQLTDYIDALSDGMEDCALVLQPAINELRLARGKNVLTETDLFVAQMQTLGLTLPLTDTAGRSEGAAQANARKLLPIFQTSLLHWLKNEPDGPTALARMGKIAEQISLNALSQPVYQLWRVLAGCVEALLSHTLEDSIELKRLFGRAGGHIKVLAEEGEEAATPQAADLSLNLLFFVGRSRGQGPRIAALRKAFQLAVFLPPGSHIEELRRKIHGPNTALLAHVSEEIRADFSKVKDAIDMAVRTGGSRAPDLTETRKDLKRIADTLTVLGLNVLQRVVVNQGKMLENVAGAEGAAPGVWMDLATSILRVEHSLEDALFRQLRKPRDTDRPELEEQVPHSRDLSEGIAALQRESLVNLAKLKGHIDAYLKNNDAGGLPEAPRLLEEIASGLGILESGRAATLIGQLRKFLASKAFKTVRESKQRADRFADAIACVEYYIEAVRDGLPQADRILDDLANYVEQLEFVEDATSEVPAIVVPPPGTVAPAAEPAPGAAELPAPAAAAEGPEIDPEIRDIFLEEAGEVQQALEGTLPQWTRDPENREHMTSIRRAFHTLKGSGRMVGATQIGEFGWALESMLNKCLDGSVPVSAPIVATIKDAVALLPALIEDFRNHRVPDARLAPLVERAQNLAAGRGAEQQAEPDMAAIFRDDAREKLKTIAQWLAGLDRSEDEFPVEQDVVRAYHTLRGAAHVVEAEALSALAGALETYLDATRSAGLKLTHAALGLLDEATAMLRIWVDQVGTQAAKGQDAHPWLQRIARVQEHVPEHAVQASADRQLAAVFAGEAFELVQKIEETVKAWSRAPDNGQAPRELKQLCHTLMGAAFMSNCAPIGNVARALFGRMDECIAGNVVPDEPAFAALLRTAEGIYGLLDAFREGQPTDEGASLSALVAEFRWRADLPPTASLLPAAAPEAPVETAPELPAEPAPELAAPPLLELPDVIEMAPVAEPAAEPAEARAAPGTVPPDEVTDPELVGIFLGEAEELMETLDQNIEALERAPADRQALSEIKRMLHTFKGGARMAGLNSIGEVGHRLESLLEDVERGQQRLDTGVFARLHNVADGLHVALDDARRGTRLDVSGLLAELEGERAAPAPARAAAPPAPPVAPPAVAAPHTPGLIEAEAIEMPPVEVLDEAPAPPAAEAEAEAVQVDAELADIFAGEAAELLETLDGALVRWQGMPGNLEPALEMQRALHTFKGGARMAGLNVMGTAAHDMETRVHAMELGREPADAGAFAELKRQVETLHHMHDLLARGDFAALARYGTPAAPAPSAPTESPLGPVAAPEPPRAEVPAADEDFVTEPLQESVAPPPAPAVAEPSTGPWDPLLFWHPEDERAGLAAMRRESARVPVEALDRMLNEAGEISIYRSRLEEHNAGIQAQLNEMTQAITRLRDQLRQMDIETDAQIAARGIIQTEGQDRYAAEFDPLEMDRYTRMQELSRALSESVGDLANLHATMDELASEAETLLLQQGRVNTEVQTGLMRTLMVPFSRQVARLQRVVRQVAMENGKQAEAVFSGIESELDRNVLERMTAPLEHLLRNSVVHGIETPEERQRNGKQAMGKVAVSLWREGTQLLIELRDDGKGLDFNAIRATAIKRGLMPADAEVADAEVARFIFEPGFSTAKALTQDAGRGIGMDVVASEVKQLGGTLELGSETGKGARFLIRLPLTLAMSQALLVGVGHEQYAVPLPSIEGIARIARDKLDDYYREDGPLLQYGGHEYRVRYLGDFIGVNRDTSLESRTVSAILVRLGEGLGTTERRVAVVVDSLLGNREIVSKAVGPQIGSIAGVSGATILANGRVVLILDVPALAQDRTRRALITLAAGKAEAVAAGEDLRDLIMVVDDSITIRRVTERLLLKHGFRVITAKDGLDAMAQLQTEQPKAILLDIEMPKADGFEVAAFVRNSERIARTPIIMITSRSGEKHRERARTFGVNRYMIKPYQEDQLLSEIRSVMKDAAAEEAA